MDHETAVRLQATERYFLGELSAAERDEFEEHAADCTRCFEDLQTADVLAANIRAVFRDRATQPAVSKRTRWLDWLRLRPVPALAFSGALNIALAVLVIYGAAQVIPSLRSRLSDYETPHASASFAVRGVSRGAVDVFTVNDSAVYTVLRFDLPRHYSKYFYSIEGAAGKVQRSGELRPPENADVLNLTVPTSALDPGEYNVRVTGSDGAQREEVGGCVLRIESGK